MYTYISVVILVLYMWYITYNIYSSNFCISNGDLVVFVAMKLNFYLWLINYEIRTCGNKVNGISHDFICESCTRTFYIVIIRSLERNVL
jgi:hypothetical protein